MRLSISALLCLATYAAIAIAAVTTNSILLLLLLILTNGLAVCYAGILATASQGRQRMQAIGFVVVFLAYVAYTYFADGGRRFSHLLAAAAGVESTATPTVFAAPPGYTTVTQAWVPQSPPWIASTPILVATSGQFSTLDVALAPLAGIFGVVLGALAYRNATSVSAPAGASHSD